jgi:hypothetical protein
MERVEEPTVSSPNDTSKPRTPAYGKFGSNTEKLLRIFEFTNRAAKSFRDELETKIGPEVLMRAREFSKRGTPKACDQKIRDAGYAEHDRTFSENPFKTS